MGSQNFVEKHGPKAYGLLGDRLYIKEGVILHGDGTTFPLKGYYMDGERVTSPSDKRLTAMFMPKWAARTWLEITEVRVERLQHISEEDARAEGAERRPTPIFPDSTHRRGFEMLWDSINRKKHPWSSNPFVWTLTFKKIN